MDVSQAIQSRRSQRRFLAEPVERELIEEVVRLAGSAPSALNLQPWLFTAVMGEELERLSRRLVKALNELRVGCAPAAEKPLPERYLERQAGLKAQMGPAIKATEAPWDDFVNQGSMHFYGAPAAIIVCGEGALAAQAQFDVGLAVGYLLLACQEKGLATCPIGLVSRYSEIIQDALNIPEDRPVILAVAVGFADQNAPVNRVKTERAPLNEIFRWYG